MSLLVTGAYGYIGKNLIVYLNEIELPKLLLNLREIQDDLRRGSENE